MATADNNHGPPSELPEAEERSGETHVPQPAEASASGSIPPGDGPGDADGLSHVPAPSMSSKQVAVNASHLKERKRRGRYLIKKLEKKLEVLDRQIQKYNEAEVSLEDMNSGTSAYLKEDLLKRKFVKTWQQLCKLQSIGDEIVIEDPEGANYVGTPYPEINRRVMRVLRLDEFPDYFDMCQLVERCNVKHNLGISGEEKAQLSKRIFKDVGKILKKRRQRDFKEHFGSHLTDRVKSEEDPALQSSELLERLKESLTKGQQALEEVCESFVVEQDKKYDNSDKSPSGDSCSENEEEEGDEEEVEVGGLEDEPMAVDLHADSPLTDSNTPSPDSILEQGSPGTPLSDHSSGVADTTLPSDSGEVTISSTVPTPSLPAQKDDSESAKSQAIPPSSDVKVATESSITSVSSSSGVVVLDSSDDDDDLIIID